MAVSALILLAVSVATYFGYYAVAVPARPWVYYPMSGLLFAVAGYVAREKFSSDYRNTDPALKLRRSVLLGGVAAGALMMGEGAQQFVGGLIDVQTGGVDVLRHALGSDAYSALMSLVCAGLLMVIWPSRR